MASVFSLLRFARGVVETVISQINEQVNNLTELVQSPIREMISTVLGGAWRGTAADSFANEMTTVVLPMVAQLIAAIGGMNASVRNCINILDRADQEARNAVNSVADQFDTIYK
jgi:uncharacterized protein YukE